MDLEQLKKLIGKSNRKKVIVGIFLFGFGAFIAWLLISGVDKSSDIGVGGEIVLIVLIALCCGLGALMIFMGIKSSADIKNGKHLLIKAINDGNKGYVLWIYENITKVQGGGSNHQVVIMTEDSRKSYNIEMKKDKVQGAIQFLSSHFPNAVLGWSDEMQQKMKDYGKIKK